MTNTGERAPCEQQRGIGSLKKSIMGPIQYNRKLHIDSLCNLVCFLPAHIGVGQIGERNLFFYSPRVDSQPCIGSSLSSMSRSLPCLSRFICMPRRTMSHFYFPTGEALRAQVLVLLGRTVISPCLYRECELILAGGSSCAPGS